MRAGYAVAWDDRSVTALFVLLALAVLGAVAVLAGGRGGELGEPGDDRPPPWLPVDRPVSPDDIDAVHFGVGFRGYRMDEVDEVLDRLAAELRIRDAHLRERGVLGPELGAPELGAPELGAPELGAPELGDHDGT
jgi:DivIVA domain-containing protein